MDHHTGPQPQEILAAPDRHIPVPFQDIFEVVKGQLSLTDREPFEEVCKALESVSRMDFTENRRRLMQNFYMFSAGARKVQLITRKLKPLPTKDDMDTRETSFLVDLMKVMNLSHFKLLKAHQWEVALAEQFQFTLPMDIKWESLETSLLTRHWEASEQRKAERADLPDIADRVLIFTRGIGQAKKSDRFITDKIDLLVEYLVAEPLLRLWAWVQEKRGKPLPAPPATPPPPPQEEPHKHAITVRRFSLRQQLPTPAAVLGKFAATIDLQEPTFKEVVVLYRRNQAQKAAASPAGMPVSGKGSKEERLSNILSKRNIHLKSFGEIAMADIELIFPEKSVQFKTVTLIQLGITVVMALFAGIMTLLEGAGWGIIMSAISVVGARFAQVYSSAQYTRALQINELSQMLYDRAQDSQEGVLTYLVEGMMEQQQKEAVLALGKLLDKSADSRLLNKSMGVGELDDACEQFLVDEFGVRVDFAVENTLPYLQNWGLVEVKGDRVEVVPMDAAKASLENYWNRTFTRVQATRRTTEGGGGRGGGLLSSFSFRKPPPMPPSALSNGHSAATVHRGGPGSVDTSLPPGLPPPPQSPYRPTSPYAHGAGSMADGDDDNMSVISVTTGQRRKKSIKDIFRRKKNQNSAPSSPGSPI